MQLPQVTNLAVGQDSPGMVVLAGKVMVFPVLPLSLVFNYRWSTARPRRLSLIRSQVLLEEPERLRP